MLSELIKCYHLLFSYVRYTIVSSYKTALVCVKLFFANILSLTGQPLLGQNIGR